MDLPPPQTAQPGWYPDHTAPGHLRYWDGQRWVGGPVAPWSGGPAPSPVPPTPRKRSWFQRWGWVLLVPPGLAVYAFVSSVWNDAQRDDRIPVTITVDKCRFDSDGWVEAGGIVTNRGERTTSVIVNLMVDGRYVDRDYIPSLAAGASTSWEVSEPGASRGRCTAQRG